ncbi:MAG: hypothetical protein ACPG45_06490 [Flavobacteriaceae bacterium]
MKAKNIYNKLTVAALTAVSLFTISCQNDDLEIARKGKPLLTLESNEITVGEGGSAYFKANLSYPINDYIAIRMELLDDAGNVVAVTEPDGGAGTGNGYSPIAHDDLNIDVQSENYPAVGVWETWFEAGAFDFGYLGGTGYVYTADKNVTSFEFPVGTLIDNITEGTETYRFRLSSTSKMNAIVDEIITVNIEDAVPTTLDVLLDFDGTITADGNSVDKCDYDFDLFISDSATANTDVAHNWDGPCNELLSAGNAGIIDNDPNNWMDGTVYYVWIDLWDNTGAPAITNHEDIPMDLVFSVVIDGVSTNRTLSLPNLYRTDSLDSNNSGAGEKLAAKIIINGNDYIITDLDGNLVQ